MWRGFTQQDASFKLQEDAPFRLFGDVVDGKVISFENNKLLKLRWRFKDWKESDYSLVVMEFNTGDASDETVVTLTHSDIPLKNKAGSNVESEDYRKGWYSQVFDRVAKILGLPLKSYELNK